MHCQRKSRVTLAIALLTAARGFDGLRAAPRAGPAARTGQADRRAKHEGQLDLSPRGRRQVRPQGRPAGRQDRGQQRGLLLGAARQNAGRARRQGTGGDHPHWFTFFPPEPQEWAPQGSATNQEMLLRIYWDDRKRPAVEAPMGDFFCNAFGKRYEVASMPVVVGPTGSYNCFWYMPFRKAARIEVVNQGTKPINLLYFNIDWIKKETMPADTPYFYAQYRQEYPLENGKDYVILDTRGKGHYVGTVLSVRTRSPNWFGEGDEKIYIDGEKKPSIWGTGTEDYFLQAWGLNKTCTPFFGTPYYDQYYRLIGSHICCYRWHLADPIVFQKGIKVTFEHYGWTSVDENPDHKLINWNEREDDFSSVAYWYQTGEPTFAARARRRPNGGCRASSGSRSTPRISPPRNTTAVARRARRNCRSCTTSRSCSSVPSGRRRDGSRFRSR